MGLLDTLLGGPRLPLPNAPETRAATGRYDGWGVMAVGHGGNPVSPHLAESLGIVTACIELIAGALGSLPPSLTMDSPDGQVPAPQTATGWALLTRPNPRQSWPACLSFLAASVLLRGNGVAALLHDGRGAVVQVVPIPWHWLAIQVIQGAAGPRLVYDVIPTTPEAQLLGLPLRLLDSDVLHLRARSDEGIIGRSVLSRAAGVVREGNALAVSAEATWKRGMRPSGVLRLPKGTKLTEDSYRRLRADMSAEYGGASNSGKTPILEDGAEWQGIGLTSVDAEFLATRRFSVEEVARIFGVPAGLVQPMAGIQPADLLPIFAQLALAPLVAVVEAEFAHAVLPPGQYLQLDMGGLMRGSFSGMTAAFAVAVQSGFCTPNDARRGLGLPAHADGDALRPGNAPSFPADAAGVPSLAPKPGHTGADELPNPGTNQNDGAG